MPACQLTLVELLVHQPSLPLEIMPKCQQLPEWCQSLPCCCLTFKERWLRGGGRGHPLKDYLFLMNYI